MTDSRHRRWRWIAAGAAAVLVAIVLFWFQPHKLFVDDRVDEAIPVVTTDSVATSAPAANDAEAPPTTVGSTEPSELARGEFVSLDHGTSGVARVLELADGSRIVRLEGLDTSNGPDLYLYLTANPAAGAEDAFDEEYLSLGRLKGNQGDQNYDLPADADLASLATVVIWCDRFDSAFGAAELVAS
jgi:hypothetical protein